LSTHSPGALRAAAAIVNSRESIPTADGDKGPGELADFIEQETRIVELIDAAQRILKEYDDAAADSRHADTGSDVSARNMEQLRQALRAVTAQSATVAGEGASPKTRGH
jgi:hypothetical protein